MWSLRNGDEKTIPISSIGDWGQKFCNGMYLEWTRTMGNGFRLKESEKMRQCFSFAGFSIFSLYFRWKITRPLISQTHILLQFHFLSLFCLVSFHLFSLLFTIIHSSKMNYTHMHVLNGKRCMCVLPWIGIEIFDYVEITSNTGIII